MMENGDGPLSSTATGDENGSLITEYLFSSSPQTAEKTTRDFETRRIWMP